MHILVVDDDGDVRDVLITMLEYHGHRISSAKDGQSMRAFLSRDNSVNAVIIDTVMPGETGITLALHAKELRLPVVMISGSPAAMKFAYENGLQLLLKPFRMQGLLNALDVAVRSGEFGQRGVC